MFVFTQSFSFSYFTALSPFLYAFLLVSFQRRMTKVLGIDFAPLSIPIERRLQTLGVLEFFFVTLILPAFTIIVPIYLVFTSLCPLVFAYMIWMWYDWDSPKKGGYRSEWFMRWKVHQWYAKYFPVRLHRTEELSSDKNYLIGYHPHGIISMSAFINFGTNGTGVLELFPSVNFHLCTLVGQFWTPLRREYGLLHGIIDCSRESLTYMLGGEKKGNACVLVVGGAEEALDAHPGHHILTLNKRKGFIKLALQTGSHLLPCYSFGENDIYNQADNPKGSTIRKIQTLLKEILGFSPPIFHGRGIFNYTFGLLPFRRDVNTVLGKPIVVNKVPNPSQEEIDRLHEEYVSQLRELFESNKTKYGVDAKTQLVIQ